MGYQKCPLCNGEGKLHIPSLSTTSAIPIETTCRVCMGEAIIDEITGMPPSKNKIIVKHMHGGEIVRVPMTMEEYIQQLNAMDTTYDH